MDIRKKYWFPAKRHGWGWGLPNSWQGGAVLVAYFVVQWLLWYFLPPAREMAPYLAGVAVSTVILIAVCWLKGEPPGSGQAP